MEVRYFHNVHVRHGYVMLVITLVGFLKGLCHAILGNFVTDKPVTELKTDISQNGLKQWIT